MLIGLHGESRAGKDSVAGILVRKYGFRQISLAKAIRDMMLEINPTLSYNGGPSSSLKDMFEWFDGDWDKIKAESRDSVDFMIALGQSARDIIGEDVWIDAAFKDYDMEDIAHNNFVVSDIRQPNEVRFIQVCGGELWLVERPGTEKRGMDGLLHYVEWKWTIHNNGTLKNLEETVDRVMELKCKFQ